MNATIPIAAHPCTYTYLAAEKLPQAGIDENTPIFVDMDNNCFLRTTDYGTIAGGFVESSIQALSPALETGEWNVPPVDWDKFCKFILFIFIRSCDGGN